MVELVTVITPVASYHKNLVQRAINSVKAQTVPCKHLILEDVEGRGAGWARNRLLEQVTTPFTVCLDSDDEIDPTFIEKTLAAWKVGTYVFTGWREGEKIKEPPLAPWQLNGEWHVITTLIPTYALRFIGGFNEELLGGEDTEAFWALTRSGLCGLPVHEPLFHYGSEGQRARSFVRSAAYEPTMQALVERYQDMPCCGADPIPPTPSNDPQPGDILALATWAGNRVEVGSASGRMYPRTGNGKQVWIDPRDAQVRPDLWRVVEATPAVKRIPIIDVLAELKNAPSAEPAQPVLDGIEQVARILFPGRVLAEPVLSADDIRAYAPVGKPDFGQVLRLAGGV